MLFRSREKRQIVQMRTVVLFLATRRELVQRHTREGLCECVYRAGTDSPGGSLHDSFDLGGGLPIVMNGYAHTMIVVFDFASHTVQLGRYDQTPPEAGEIVDGGGQHGLNPA